MTCIAVLLPGQPPFTPCTAGALYIRVYEWFQRWGAMFPTMVVGVICRTRPDRAWVTVAISFDLFLVKCTPDQAERGEQWTEQFFSKRPFVESSDGFQIIRRGQGPLEQVMCVSAWLSDIRCQHPQYCNPVIQQQTLLTVMHGTRNIFYHAAMKDTLPFTIMSVSTCRRYGNR